MMYRVANWIYVYSLSSPSSCPVLSQFTVWLLQCSLRKEWTQQATWVCTRTFGRLVWCGAWHKLTMHRGFMHLASGMSVGLTGVAAGYTIGVVGDAVRILLFVIQLRWSLETNIHPRVFGHTCNNPESMLEWFWFWSSAKSWVFMGKCILWSRFNQSY